MQKISAFFFLKNSIKPLFMHALKPFTFHEINLTRSPPFFFFRTLYHTFLNINKLITYSDFSNICPRVGRSRPKSLFCEDLARKIIFFFCASQRQNLCSCFATARRGGHKKANKILTCCYLQI